MAATLRFVKRAAPTSVPTTTAPKPVVPSGGCGVSAAPTDSRDAIKLAIINSAHEYLSDPPAMIALLYRNRTLYDACPPGVPSSELGRNRHGADFQVPEHFNHPHGMKSMNAMLRHTYNYFNEFCQKMNFNDFEATSNSDNVVFFRARAVRNEIVSVFTTLYESSRSKTKQKDAEKIYQRILDCITSLPPTPAERECERERERERERRMAALAAVEEARREAEKERAAKAAADAFAAAHGGVRPEDCW